MLPYQPSYYTPQSSYQQSLYNPQPTMQQLYPQQAPQVPQVPSPSYLSGKIVRDISEVTPQDVPMNGQISIFPTADGSSVYLKTWDGNGRIQTVRYIPEPVEKATPTREVNQFDEINATISDMKQQLDRIEKQVNYKYQKNTPRNNRPQNQESNDD